MSENKSNASFVNNESFHIDVNMNLQEEEEKGTPEETESIDEEVEPKLKYLRISNDLKVIFLKDAASCIVVHPKFVCIGTHFGRIHLLDHQGNAVQGIRKLPSHTLSVNQISIDKAGETIATCSDDGKVHVVPLFATENQDDQTLNIERLVKAVALDPAPGAQGGKRLVVGYDKLTLYERTGFLGRWRATVLCEAEGHVMGLSWGGDFIAWASAVGVRVYDTVARCSLGLIQWEGGSSNSQYRCNLRWCGTTLLIGWVDTVRVCHIGKRSRCSGTIGLPEHIVDPVSTFPTSDLLVSGVASLGTAGNQLVLLGVPKGQEDLAESAEGGKDHRPQLRVVEYRGNEYTEFCTDYLSLRGYQEWGCNDYHLDVLPDEDRLFLVAPKDIVEASPYEPDDRVQWFVQHCRYEEALSVVRSANCRRHTEISVGGTYLDYLLMERRWQEAARLCLRIFGQDRAPWQEHVYKFACAHQLRAVAPYLPRNPAAPLDPQIYEMVLYEHLRLDPTGFLSLVHEWKEPGLYNTAAVINAVLERLLVIDTEDKRTLMEALAVLYEKDGRNDKAVAMYLKLGHPNIFAHIQRNGLQQAVHTMIVDLMRLNAEKACELLLSSKTIGGPPVVSPDVVIAHVENHESLLHAYLHALDQKDTKLSSPYHGRMVKLYSKFDRKRLLPFLKRSDQYPIQEALEICQKQKYYPEMVYLLGRIGDTREALELINRELGDMQQALAFCQEHDDPDLWQDLINYSLNKPELITFLLPRIGGHVDPQVLVQRIGSGVEIPGLKNALVSMLHQSRLQAGIQEGCQKLLVADYFGIHERLVCTQKRGFGISEELVCGACHRKLLTTTGITSATKPLVVYNCRHIFHEQCLPLSEATLCAICHPHQHNSLAAQNCIPAKR